MPWSEILSACDPEGAALIIRLLMAHMAMTEKRLLEAMVLDRLDAESVVHNDVHEPGCPQASEHEKSGPLSPLRWNGGGGLPAPVSQLGDKADFTPSPLMGQAATGAA